MVGFGGGDGEETSGMFGKMGSSLIPLCFGCSCAFAMNDIRGSLFLVRSSGLRSGKDG